MLVQGSKGNLAEIVIGANKNDSKVQRAQMSVVDVLSAAIKDLSGLLENREVLKIIQLPKEDRREEHAHLSLQKSGSKVVQLIGKETAISKTVG